MSDPTVEYLYSRGQLAHPRVTALAGGVSGQTVLVEMAAQRLVVKRALERLLVAGEWRAKPERAMTEARALDLLHRLTPSHSPELLDADPATNTIVMSAAPADWVPWKSILLGVVPAARADILATAATLGQVLGTWHSSTWHDDTVAAEFCDYEAFEQLRISPFHRTVATRHPAVAGQVGACLDELLSSRDCLVHGDFSPKNVLVGRDGLMVIDFEVAHFGAAVFDLAFMQCHLVLKAMHRPDHSAVTAEAADQFITAYRDACPTAVHRLDAHIACLLLARVDGLSPAGYLDAVTADAVRRLAIGILRDSDPSAPGIWQRLRESMT
jgi:tRNA A-37 threonylcarbamoyl transferase component Bud32